MNKTKEFAKKAIENGHGNGKGICSGWDWIRENIKDLDYIFQSEEYKKQEGYKYKCMPFLVTEDMKEEEIDAISTAWYVNNEREHKKKEEEKQNKIEEMGFIAITGDEKELDGKKIEILIDKTGNFFGGVIKEEGKLKWVESDKRLWAFKKRYTRRGYPMYKGNNIYIKIK